MSLDFYLIALLISSLKVHLSSSLINFKFCVSMDSLKSLIENFVLIKFNSTYSTKFEPNIIYNAIKIQDSFKIIRFMFR
jgi:hypothetical protein